MPAVAEQYLTQLQQLLPEGAAWPRDPEAVLTKVLYAFADEYARAHNRLEDLIEEADPRTTYELLPDWERVAGLPDDCAGQLGTIEERQIALTQHLTTVGGQSRNYFTSLAEQLGYPDATITEFRPLTCIGECTGSLDPDPWRFVWRLEVPQETRITELSCEGACIEPLRNWGDALLECVVSRLKPAHTKVIFAYGV